MFLLVRDDCHELGRRNYGVEKRRGVEGHLGVGGASEGME